MKNYLLTALLLTACLATASAQRREIKEPRVRFGVGYRYSMALREQFRIKAGSIDNSVWFTPDQIRGGELLLEGTVRIDGNWNTGLGVGFGGYDKSSYQTFKVYLKGERLYGQRASRWLNYANLGATLYPGQNTGLVAELGGGYRLAITRRTRLDFTVGLEYVNLIDEIYDHTTGQSYQRGARLNRYGLTVGIAMHF